LLAVLALAQLLVLFVASPSLAGAHEAETASGEIFASLDGEHTYFVGESGAWVHNTCFPSASRIGELRQAVGVLRGGGYANPVVRRQIIESATNGATFSRLNAARVAQVRSVVERLGQPVHLVGSRVNPGKVLNPYSDFDFVIGGLRSKTRRFALDNLPAGYGPSGERLVDIFESGLAPGEPSITFFLP
jgi:hypothetical protein